VLLVPKARTRRDRLLQESSLTDPEIVELCEQIVQTQREEIAQMEGILERG
jgi:uncharacterized protein (DUF305 family)